MYRKNRMGFSLVELLAVVLILAVLAAVAIPLYINTRKSSAARACKGNIAAIAAAESAFALRNGQYTITPLTDYVTANLPTTGLIGAPEGLSGPLVCPLTNTATYSITTDQPATGAGTAAVAADVTPATAVKVYVHCSNVGDHLSALGTGATAADFAKQLAPPAAEVVP